MKFKFHDMDLRQMAQRFERQSGLDVERAQNFREDVDNLVELLNAYHLVHGENELDMFSIKTDSDKEMPDDMADIEHIFDEAEDWFDPKPSHTWCVYLVHLLAKKRFDIVYSQADELGNEVIKKQRPVLNVPLIARLKLMPYLKKMAGFQLFSCLHCQKDEIDCTCCDEPIEDCTEEKPVVRKIDINKLLAKANARI